MRFNATTAFLLPPARPDKSCRTKNRFNATTAFLLPGESEGPTGARFRFNATTAFLLLKGGKYFPCPCSAFQCHHGVPASIKESRTAIVPTCFNATTAFLLPGMALLALLLAIVFQCHHGVPASLRGDPRGS